MFNIAFRDSSFHPKQLPLFCLVWLISASADRIDYTVISRNSFLDIPVITLPISVG